MRLAKIPFDQTGSFSGFFLDYISQQPALTSFYHRFPTLGNFHDQIKEKQAAFPASHRETLVGTLRRQYGNLKRSERLDRNLSCLANDNTFTITTGHQLNIFTGPLYFVYKIVTVINACKQLKATYPEYDFVPVYWMASEDHDYDEIKSIRLYGTKYTWHTQQAGAVGRFVNDGLDQLCNELPGDPAPFREAYKKGNTLSSAVRQYVNTLFGDQGLVVIDGDDREFKREFESVIAADILDHRTQQQVGASNQALQETGYEPQVYCREINFFYLEDGLRARLQTKNDGFEVVDSNKSFTVEEIKELIKTHPERFSPNVLLRPLYQETILPNLAYVGGPAEVVYWLQLKAMFDSQKLPFPILLPRNFATVLEPHVFRKFEKTGLRLDDLFLSKHELLEKWVLMHTPHALTTGEERKQIESIFKQLSDRLIPVDETLKRFLGAQKKRMLNSLETIERKAIRAEKRKQKEKFGQIESVKDALFPNGNLQERTDNMLNFYQRDPAFIQKLYDTFDPFDFHMHILLYEEGEL